MPLLEVHDVKSKAVCQECLSDIFIQHIVQYSLKAQQNDNSEAVWVPRVRS